MIHLILNGESASKVRLAFEAKHVSVSAMHVKKKYELYTGIWTVITLLPLNTWHFFTVYLKH